MAKALVSGKKQKEIINELTRVAKNVGLKVSSGKLFYAGLKLKSGQCSLREESWLVVDKTQPYEDQIELYKRALADLELPDDLPECVRGILNDKVLPLDNQKTAS
ncbi:MAG: hypothetical protein LBP22_00860 [Deltaproteobacteria bacterium]|jgi:hypothetical protein|nr:hypothetical protein [Deltaproteobacteria bacterium]